MVYSHEYFVHSLMIKLRLNFFPNSRSNFQHPYIYLESSVLSSKLHSTEGNCIVKTILQFSTFPHFFISTVKNFTIKFHLTQDER